MNRIVQTLAMAAVVGLVTVPASAGAPDPRALPDLREAPGIPVNSIILRRAFPDHPVPATPARDVPGRGAPLEDGRPAPGGGGCDKDVDLTGTIAGVTAVAAQDNGICTNADIDTYVRGSDTYVVQAGGEQAAWTHTLVTVPSSPEIVGQFVWTGGSGKATYTPDLKTFRQDGSDYIVMGLERTKANGFCGVVIYNVTDPANPVLESQYIGSTTIQDFGPSWCDTHNVFVENDGNGDGQYIYATADAPNDMRVLDISGTVDVDSSVTNPIEIGRYVSPTANNSNYVHDITVLDHAGSVGRRVYLSYWAAGLVILDAADVTPGTPGNNPTPVVGPNAIDPPGFLTHHAWASQDGSRVFIQDEFLNSNLDEPVQMWNVTNPANPVHVDSLVLGTDVPVNPAHNLEIRDDIDLNRLYVAWYKLGFQAWDFTSTGFDRNFNAPNTADLFHQAQTEASDAAYSGAWGVRLALIDGLLYIFPSDRNFGLIVDCEGCATPASGTVTGTVSAGGSPIQGASVGADTGQGDTTDASGGYTLNDVPAGTRIVTASATGYLMLQFTNVGVNDGLTTTVDFALDPEPVGGGTGSIKGTATDASTGAKLSGVLVMADTGESATTNNGGKYNIRDVPEGSRTVTASKTGYDDLPQPATVTAGQTTPVNFALVPVP